MVLYILVWIVFCMLNSLLGSFSDVMDRLVARVFFSIFLLKESKTCLIHMFHKQKKLLVNNFRPGNRLVPLYACQMLPSPQVLCKDVCYQPAAKKTCNFGFI